MSGSAGRAERPLLEEDRRGLPPEPASPALLRRRLRISSSSLSFFPGGDGHESCDPRLGLRFTVSWGPGTVSF